MNKTETHAFDWIKSKGYTGIIYQPRYSPDFLTEQGTGFEIKLCRNHVIVISSTQWNQINSHPDVHLIIFDSPESINPVEDVPFDKLKKPPSYWKHFRLTDPCPNRELKNKIWQCKKCGWRWASRSKHKKPFICPNCRKYTWDE